MRTFKLLSMLCLLWAMGIVANAYDFSVNGIYYNIISSSTASVTFKEFRQYGSNKPSDYKGQDFGDDDSWNWYCWVSDYSGNINIPQRVSYNSKTYTVTGIGDYAFCNCSNINTITVPSTIKTIGTDAFSFLSGCNPIGIIDGDLPANSCKGSKFGSVELNCTTISNYEFASSQYITSVSLGSKVSTIGNFAFSDCFYLRSIAIPDNVTSIGAYAFSNCSLQNVTLPENMSSIPSGMFLQCTSLVSIKLPKNISSISEYAFSKCYNLSSMIIPNSVQNIGSKAFDSCTKLKDVTVNWTDLSNLTIAEDVLANVTLSNSTLHVPAGTKSLYEDADVWKDFGTIVEFSPNITFADLNVKAICVANWDTDNDGELSEEEAAAVTDLGNVFKNNSNITTFDELKYFAGLKSVGTNAFSLCTGLTSITIPSSVSSIGYHAFWECSALTSITIPGSVTSIGSDAFSYCSKLTNITIPTSVTSIGSNAFFSCSNLTSITIPNSVTSIGNDAFSSCSKLASITLPKSVTAIGNSAFSNCTNLTDITVNWDSPLTDTNELFRNSSMMATLHVPVGTVEAYNSVQPWSDFRSITDSVIAISDHFELEGIGYNLLSLDDMTVEVAKLDKPNKYTGEIVIPETVSYGGSTYLVIRIGNDAFNECSDLLSVSLPNSITSIGAYAFRSCGKMQMFSMSNSVQIIENNAFQYCYKLTSINLPSTLTEIGHDAFTYCTSLTSIEIPSNLTSIGLYAFGNHPAVISITVDPLNPVFDSRDNCNALIESSTNTLIEGCKKTIIPNSVTSIQHGAFYNCVGLETIEIPNSVQSIGYDAFCYCSDLTEVSIPASVKSIGERAFLECTKLKDITVYWDKPISVVANCFAYGNHTKITLHVPAGTKALYEAADVWKDFGTIVEDKPKYNVEDLALKKFSISSRVTEIVPNTWYVMYQKFTNAGYVNDSGIGNRINKSSSPKNENNYTFNTSKYLVRFIEGKSSDEGSVYPTYYVQFGTGNYIGEALVNTWRGEVVDPIIVKSLDDAIFWNSGQISDTVPGHFWFTRDYLSSRIDNDGTDVNYWENGIGTELNSNYDWAIYSVDFTDISEQEEKLAMVQDKYNTLSVEYGRLVPGEYYPYDHAKTVAFKEAMEDARGVLGDSSSTPSVEDLALLLDRMNSTYDEMKASMKSFEPANGYYFVKARFTGKAMYSTTQLSGWKLFDESNADASYLFRFDKDEATGNYQVYSCISGGRFPNMEMSVACDKLDPSLDAVESELELFYYVEDSLGQVWISMRRANQEGEYQFIHQNLHYNGTCDEGNFCGWEQYGYASLWSLQLVDDETAERMISKYVQEPTKPEVPAAGELVVGENYLVRLAANGQYLASGNAWSTQLSITDEGMDSKSEPIVFTIDSLTAAMGETEVRGLSLKLNGSFFAYGEVGQRGVGNTLIFRDNDIQAFVDYMWQGNGYIWNITKVGDYYRIQTAAGDPKFPNAASEYIGWNAAGSEYNAETGWHIGQTHVECNIVPTEEAFSTYKYDWELIPADTYLNDLRCYQVRLELHTLLVDAQKLIDGGASLNIVKYSQIYNNGTSTYDELITATKELKYILYGLTLEDASENNPKDATGFIYNSDFDSCTDDGWDLTIADYSWRGYQDNQEYSNDEATLRRFIETWRYGCALSDGEISQKLYALPAGRWKLTCDAIAVNQYDDNPCVGVQLFAKGGEIEVAKEMHTKQILPERFELDFISTGTEFTIGLRTNSTTANWIAADNFKLTYYGDNIIDFADSNVKALCVANWDTNGDGELSESEAAAVKDLGDTFTSNNEIRSFNELKYFIGLKTIGYQAFSACRNLVEVNLPNSIHTIGFSAFWDCQSLRSISIPQSVNSIVSHAFSHCPSLEAITVDASNRTFSSANNCNAIIEKSTKTLRIGCKNTIIPNDIKAIGYAAFNGSAYLTSIELPSSVTEIHNEAFGCCTSLSKIVMPNVESIGGLAFFETWSLKEIRIPNTVTSIGYKAFEESGISDLTVSWNKPLSVGDSTFIGCDLGQATLHVPAGTKALYEAANVWKDFGTIVEQYSHDADNIIYADDVTGRLDARTVQVPLYLNNSVSMCAAEFYLTLPEGISIKQEFDEEEEEYVWGIEKGGRLRAEHGISCKQEVDGDYHFICSDLISNKNFFDSQDRKGLPFMTLTLVFDENLTNGDYELMIHDLILNHNGEESVDEYKADEIPSTLSLPKKQLFSVSSNDEAFGTASFVAATYDEEYGDVSYGDEVTLTANPGQGYKFVRWANGGEELSTENPLTLSVVSDMSIVAEFVLSQVTVTFNVDGAEYSSGLQTCGSKLTLPDAPTKTGYTFRGWTNVTDDTIVPNQDVTYEAVFDINRYQVAFLDYNGTPIYQQSQDWGSEITAPADPVREDWFFLGWSPEVDATVPMNDVTYTAQYTLRGDVTGDNVRNVTDLTTLVNIILNKSQVDARTFTAANVHVDNVLNITDLTSIVNLILNVGSGAQKVKPAFGESRAFLSMDDVNAMAGFNAVLSIRLNSNDEDITAGQFDLVLPEGVSLASVKASERLASSHVVGAQTQEDGTVRVLFFSMRNDVAKSEEGSVIDIELCIDGNLLDGQYDITMKDAVLTTPDERSSKKDMTTARINVGNATSIDGVNRSQSMTEGDAYNLAGQPVGENHKGIAIKDGKKVYNK